MWVQVVDNKKVKEAIKESGYRKSFICEQVGIKSPSLCKFLKCGWGLSEGKLRSIADFLEVDFKDLLFVPEPDGKILTQRDVDVIKDYILANIEE